MLFEMRRLDLERSTGPRDGAVTSIDRGFTARSPAHLNVGGWRVAAATIWSCPNGPRCAQLRTMPCPAGPGAAIPVNRTNAVALTAIAPMTEKIICQVADGMAICARPWVAL